MRKGGITIRYSRLRKFGQKNKLLWMSAKIVAVWYLLLGMSVSLTGQTNAYFSDTTGITVTIQMGNVGR